MFNAKVFGLKAFWIFADKPIKAIEKLFIFGYMPLILSEYSFGLLVEISALFMLPAFFLESGLRVVVQEDSVQGNINNKSYLYLRLLGGFLYFISILVMGYFSISDKMVLYVVLCVAFVRSLSFWDYKQFLLLAERDFRGYSVREIGSILFSVVFIFITLKISNSLLPVLTFLLLSKVFKSFLYIPVKLGSYIPEIDPNFTAKIKQAVPWLFANMAGILLLKSDIYMIDVLLKDPVQSARYGLAVTFNEFWWFIPTGLGVLWSKSIMKDTIQGSRNDKYIYSLVLAFLYILGAYFLAPILIKNYYGDAYQDVPVLLNVLSFAGIGMAIFPILKWELAARNQARSALVIQLSALCLNIVLNTILIPRYGILGASIATAVGLNSIVFVYIIIRIFNGLSLR